MDFGGVLGGESGKSSRASVKQAHVTSLLEIVTKEI